MYRATVSPEVPRRPLGCEEDVPPARLTYPKRGARRSLFWTGTSSFRIRGYPLDALISAISEGPTRCFGRYTTYIDLVLLVLTWIPDSDIICLVIRGRFQSFADTGALLTPEPFWYQNSPDTRALLYQRTEFYWHHYCGLLWAPLYDIDGTLLYLLPVCLHYLSTATASFSSITNQNGKGCAHSRFNQDESKDI